MLGLGGSFFGVAMALFQISFARADMGFEGLQISPGRSTKVAVRQISTAKRVETGTTSMDTNFRVNLTVGGQHFNLGLDTGSAEL
jgi:hypothetical protein